MAPENHESTTDPNLWHTEVENFVHTVRLIRPPNRGMRVGQVEVYGDSVFLNPSAGGDHIVYVDFDRRYDLDRRIRAANDDGARDEPFAHPAPGTVQEMVRSSSAI